MRRVALGTEVFVERQRIAHKIKSRTETEIGLIDVTRADPLMHARETGGVSGLAPLMSQRPGIGARPGSGGERLGMIENPEPQKRNFPVPRQERRKPGLQQIAKLVSEIPGGVFPGPPGGFQRRKGNRHLARLMGRDDGPRPRKGVIFEQNPDHGRVLPPPGPARNRPGGMAVTLFVNKPGPP